MSFDEIYQNNYAAVYILARRMVNDEDVSKDIAQDVFLRLYDVLGSGEKILNVGGWLGRVTYNHSLNHLRDSSRVVNHIAIDKADTDGATDGKLIESEDAEWVRKAVGRLEAREQSLIRLWCSGMSYRKISDITGIRYTSVGSTLSRILKKLKRIYNEEERKMRR